MNTKPETKAAAKAREIAERKAAIAEKKLAERRVVFATPIAKAVAPLKITAIAAAEIAANKWVADQVKALEEVAFDLNKLAPSPNSMKDSRESYHRKQNRRHSFECITNHVEQPGVYNDQSWHNMTLPRIVEISPEGVAQQIKNAKEMAAESYEGFVYKMVGKVGAHTAATLTTRDNVWGESVMTVTLADGTIQKWKTQIILNCSIYGKLFNQWPSRVVK